MQKEIKTELERWFVRKLRKPRYESQGVIVDDWVKPFLNNMTVNVMKRGYVRVCKQRGDSYERVMLHRILTQCPEGMYVDHINGDPLDNRLCNLRVVSSSENSSNRHIHREGHLQGTCYSKREKKWKAGQRKGNRRVHIGTYDTAEEAHEAWKEYQRRVKDDLLQQQRVHNEGGLYDS